MCYASQPRRSTPRPRLARPAGASPLSPQTLNPGRSPRSSARDDPEHRASPPRGCDENEEKKSDTANLASPSLLIRPPPPAARVSASSVRQPSVRPSVHPSPSTSLVANFPRPNAEPDAIRESINHSVITWRTCASTPLPAPGICWDPSCRFAQSPGRAGRRGWDRRGASRWTGAPWRW